MITVRPRADAFDIELHIKPEYRKLLTPNSVFWAEGGAKVQLNGSGLTVQASPLSRALRGAISFDNLGGGGGVRGKFHKGRRILSRTRGARARGQGPFTTVGFKLGEAMRFRLLAGI